MSPDLAIPASPAALRNEGSGFLPLTAKAASFSGIGYARRNGETLCMGQFQGGFALCTVSGAEFLDKDFRRIEPLLVSQPVPAYLRVVRAEADPGANTLVLKLSTKTDDGQPVTPATNISLARVGSSSTFLGALTLVPSEYPSQPNLRAGEDPAPTFVAPLGFGELKATEASDAEIALRGTLFAPKLVLSFLKREAECAFTIDTCLTSGPEGTQPGSLQQTEIDPGNGYAEVVRVLVRTVNPFRESIPEELRGKTLRFEEHALHEYQEEPSLGRYRKFYEGVEGSSSIEEDGTLRGPSGAVEEHTLTEGRAAFSLAAVATARYDAQGQVIRTDLQGPGLGYETAIRVKTRLRSRSGNEWPLESEAFHIGQWVNERRYCRNRVAPSLGWCDPPSRATDWLEMRVLDFLSAPLSAKAPEADSVLARASTIVDDWDLTPPADGKVLLSAPSEIRIKPEWVYFRVPPSFSGQPYSSSYWGLGYQINSEFFFDWLISHEARHAWAFQLGSAEGRTDDDSDRLYPNPPSTTPELTDAAFPGNPELTFQGDTVNEVGRAEWQAAQERTAVRWAAKNVGGEASCRGSSWSLTYDNNLQVITANGLYEAWNGCPAAAAGFAFRVDSAPLGTSCEAADEAWHSEGVFSLDEDGRAVVAPPAAGEYRFSLIRPRECAEKITRACASVPAR